MNKLMGGFGGKHRDIKDGRAHKTYMCADSNVPEEELDRYQDESIPDDAVWDPGCFFILDLNIVVELIGFVCIVFCGLHPHCASPPRAPRGVVPPNHIYRMATVAYPPEKMMEATHTIPLMPLPASPMPKSIFEVTPAMQTWR